MEKYDTEKIFLNKNIIIVSVSKQESFFIIIS